MNTNIKAKRVLIYGDSYTNDLTFIRTLRNALGEDFEIIAEGLSGRTIDGENKFFQYRNGFPQFGPILGSHLPVDLIIIFLGTNDINSGSGKIPEKVVKSMEQYLERIIWWCNHLESKEPKIMIVAPPVIDETASYKVFKDMFKGSESASRKLPKLMEKFANNNDLLFFDASKVVKVSKVDGIHLDEENSKILSEELAKAVISYI